MHLAARLDLDPGTEVEVRKFGPNCEILHMPLSRVIRLLIFTWS